MNSKVWIYFSTAFYLCAWIITLGGLSSQTNQLLSSTLSISLNWFILFFSLVTFICSLLPLAASYNGGLASFWTVCIVFNMIFLSALTSVVGMNFAGFTRLAGGVRTYYAGLILQLFIMLPWAFLMSARKDKVGTQDIPLHQIRGGAVTTSNTVV